MRPIRLRPALLCAFVALLASGCGTASSSPASDEGDTTGSDAAQTDTDAAGSAADSSDAKGSDVKPDVATADAADAAPDVPAPDAADAVDAAADATTVADTAATPDAAADTAADTAGDVVDDAADAASDAEDAAADTASDAADVPDVLVDVFTGCTSTEACDDGDAFTQDSCGSDGLCTHTPLTTYSVGIATGAGAGAGVSVPVGAMPASLVLTATPGTTIASDGTAIGPAIQFGPSGTQFAVPVTVTVPYDAAQLAGDVTLTILRREDDTQQVTGLDPTAMTATLVSAETSSFSTFQAFAVTMPHVTGLTADKLSLPSVGGAVTLTFAATGAQLLTLTATPAGPKLPVLLTTDTTAKLVLPANANPTAKQTYTLTLTATGATGSHPAAQSIVVDVQPNKAEIYTKVVAGWDSWAALTSDGHVVTWGGNNQGQSSVPNGLSGVVDIAASATAMVALKSDGTIVQWGDIGTPYTTPPSGKIVAIAGGEVHFLAAMADGTVGVWYADNSSGQATVPAGLTGVVAVAAGDAHSLALKSDGTIVGWGNDYGMQVSGPMALTNATAISAGRGTSMVVQQGGQATFFGSIGGGAYPVPGASALTNTVAIAQSYYTTCTLKSDGTMVAFGTYSNYGFTAPPGDLGFKTVAAGANFCVGLRADGSIASFASGTAAQLPFAAMDIHDAVAVSVNPQLYGSASNSDSHTLVLRKNGTVVGWVNAGTDGCGAANPPAGLTDVKAIAAGGQYSLALKTDGTIAAWGCGGAVNVPAELTGVTGIAAGGEHALAITADGVVHEWGGTPSESFEWSMNGYYPPPTGASCSPCPGAVFPANAVTVVAGSESSAAILADGTLSTWGLLFTNPNTPPAGLGKVKSVSEGGLLAGAVKTDGTVAIWGLSYADPGDPDPASITGAVSIAVGSSWNQPTAADAFPGTHWFVLLADGTVTSGGSPFFNYSVDARKLTGIVALSAGEHTGAALRFDGTVRGWGLTVVGGR